MTVKAVRTVHKTTVELPEHEIADFDKRMAGNVLHPGEPAYDEARSLWNAMIDRKPALIASCQTAEDVSLAVQFAARNGALMSIRGGGHNIAGSAVCEGGVMIDLTPMNEVTVDPETRRVDVGPGAVWGDVDKVTQPHGLAVPSGIISTTGVAGLTLGGGFGWLTRKWGYTCDRLREVEIVTADGEIIIANEHERPELLWALRGGGGNFGVVTRFTFEAVPHGPEVYAGLILFPIDRAPDVIDAFREVTVNAPNDLGSLLIHRLAPPAPFIPEEFHGQPVSGIAICWSGDHDEAEKHLGPIRALGEPLVNSIKVKPFTEHQTFLDSGQPHGRRYYWKSEFLDRFEPGMTDVIVTAASGFRSPHSAMLSMHLGGTGRTAGTYKTASTYRDAEYIFVPQSSWEDPAEDERQIEWARTTHAGSVPYSSGLNYVNFQTSEEDGERVQQGFDPDVYARLQEVKRQLDPSNLFRMNKNILPA